MRSAFLCAALFVTASALAVGQSQYKVLYSFGATNGFADGLAPNEGLVFDGAGNLYGTTETGGSTEQSGPGVAFELSPTADGQWTETVLYDFCYSCPVGYNPMSGLAIDQKGNLYGTTALFPNLGAVFELSPPSSPGGAWTAAVLWTAEALENTNPLVLDASGNLYGTSSSGGEYGYGMVYELSPPSSPGGNWTPTTLHSFCPGGFFDCPDGAGPSSGVVLDVAGNLYGMAGGRGSPNYGTVYELSTGMGSDWTETVLHVFNSGYDAGLTGLAVDPAGNVYGTLPAGGLHSSKYCSGPCGGVFELVKRAGWRVRSFGFDGLDGGDPLSNLYLDSKTKTAYGLTYAGGTQALGTIYKIDGAGETVLYNFCSQPNCTDGGYPIGGGSLTPSAGKLYGTVAAGGSYDQGAVFEFTP